MSKWTFVCLLSFHLTGFSALFFCLFCEFSLFWTSLCCFGMCIFFAVVHLNSLCLELLQRGTLHCGLAQQLFNAEKSPVHDLPYSALFSNFQGTKLARIEFSRFNPNSTTPTRKVQQLEFSVEAMVCGYHVYQSVWTPTVGEELPSRQFLVWASSPTTFSSGF